MKKHRGQGSNAIPLFEVIKPGLYTTVQDLGRTGYQRYGMVVSGAMDPYASQLANTLVGNPVQEATLEITLQGPELRLLTDALLAIGGADLSAALDGKPIPPWRSFVARRGETLSFGPRKTGARAYLAVAGGYHIPLIMGSKSTYAPAKIGGLEGRPLQKGDLLYAQGDPFSHSHIPLRRLGPEHIPDYSQQVKIRVIPGPEADAFTEESLRTFLTQPYRITPQSNRMGYRLSGPTLDFKTGADIISDAVAPGTIQVPSDGQPIILMADRQTTGGYTRIATVISVDIPQLAQRLPGDTISFTDISLAEAQRLYRLRERFLRSAAASRYFR